VQIEIVRPRLDQLLSRYEYLLGNDYEGYLNHVLRVITYAMFFLKNEEDHELVVEVVCAYYNIGPWVNRELEYLVESQVFAQACSRKFGWDINPTLLHGTIHWHHKLIPYEGQHQKVIEACRKANWIDISKGRIRKGLPESAIAIVEDAFPNLGFHKSLLRLMQDNGSSRFRDAVTAELGIVKWH